jgi:hypothetical protein
VDACGRRVAGGAAGAAAVSTLRSRGRDVVAVAAGAWLPGSVQSSNSEERRRGESRRTFGRSL